MSLPASADLPNYPFPANARQFDFEFIRMVQEIMIGAATSMEGIAGASTDFALTPGTGLTINAAAGRAFVKGDDRATQGSYFVYNDASKARTAAAANATNPRVDRVVLRVYDADVTGVSTKWDIEIIAGTPTAGATLTNLSGAAAVPNGALLLANLLVPAAFAGPFVAGTHLQDRRYNAPIAGRLLFNGIHESTADISSTNVAAGANSGVFQSVTVIGDGVTPIALDWEGSFWFFAAGAGNVGWTIWDGPIGGTGAFQAFRFAGGTSQRQPLTCRRQRYPAFAGAKTFNAAVFNDTGATATITLSAGPGRPSQLTARWVA